MTLEQEISTTLRAEHEKERASHSPSGKLSASMLHWPLREQFLKLIGVPPKPVDDYALRLFKRGKQVEDWVCSFLKGDEQVEIDYKGVIGFVDKVQDGVPIEIKSIKSSNYKWIQKRGVSKGHSLQAGLYALALKADTYKVLYVVADDFRTCEFELQTSDIKPEVDKIILEVAQALKTRQIPPYVAREDWQEPEKYQKYSNYPEWLSLDVGMATEKLKNQFPDIYKKLKGGQSEVNG